MSFCDAVFILIGLGPIVIPCMFKNVCIVVYNGMLIIECVAPESSSAVLWMLFSSWSPILISKYGNVDIGLPFGIIIIDGLMSPNSVCLSCLFRCCGGLSGLYVFV